MVLLRYLRHPAMLWIVHRFQNIGVIADENRLQQTWIARLVAIAIAFADRTSKDTQRVARSAILVAVIGIALRTRSGHRHRSFAFQIAHRTRLLVAG